MKPVEVAFTLPDTILPGADFGDTFQMVVEGQNLNAIEAAKRAVYGAPSWVNRLLELRNLLVRPFGLKPGEDMSPDKAGPNNVGLFPVLEQGPNRVLLGMNDRHLDFRLVVNIAEKDNGRQLITASTIVKTHNVLGRTYLALVKPFHKIIVPTMMARIGNADKIR